MAGRRRPLMDSEIKRKAFHLFTLLYAVLFATAGRRTSLEILGVAFLLVATVEAVRLRRPKFNQRIIRLFAGIHREKETDRPSGILWTMAGAILTIGLVPYPDIVLACLGYLAVGDAAAALVGKRWGHIRYGDKSLEGSAACFLTCWVVGIFVLNSPGGRAPEAAVGAFAAALLEGLPLPFDDNLWIPVASGLVLTALRAR